VARRTSLACIRADGLGTPAIRQFVIRGAWDDDVPLQTEQRIIRDSEWAILSVWTVDDCIASWNWDKTWLPGLLDYLLWTRTRRYLLLCTCADIFRLVAESHCATAITNHLSPTASIPVYDLNLLRFPRLVFCNLFITTTFICTLCITWTRLRCLACFSLVCNCSLCFSRSIISIPQLVTRPSLQPHAHTHTHITPLHDPLARCRLPVRPAPRISIAPTYPSCIVTSTRAQQTTT